MRTVGISTEVRQQERKADHSRLSSAKVQELYFHPHPHPTVVMALGLIDRAADKFHLLHT
jgi:hypothetical protein